jgi:tetratricopeptide (TPR) repeat protein
MNHLAAAYLGTGEFARARALFEETLSVARGTGNERLIETVTMNLGYVAVVEGRYEDAEAWLQEAYDLAQRAPGSDGAALALENLALSALLRNDLANARERVRECLEAFRSLHSDVGLFETILLAAALVGHEDPRPAVRLQSAARGLAARRGYEISSTELELAEEALSSARAEIGEAGIADEWALGERLSRDAAVELALQSID